MRRGAIIILLLSLLPGTVFLGAQDSSLLPRAMLEAIASEFSGEGARATVQELTLYHRQRGSRGFAAALRVLERKAGAYGVAAEVLHFPADGKIYYGTQRSRPAWDAEQAELWEMERDSGAWRPGRRIASYRERPITLAEDSASGRVDADLVDVGAGTRMEDYREKEVRGRLVLVSSQPGAVQSLAVERLGAAGIISYAQNQVTAWWKEDENLVRWGHLRTFPAPATFAFMVSLKQARLWQERLRRGETVRLRARVDAGQHPGSYDILSVTLPGADPRVGEEEILFTCHLDHQQPGANDNASGCATILEVARTLATLIRQGRIPPPRRTLRFLWPPEVEGSLAFLEGRPDMARRIRADIHLDMVGGGPVTGAILHITRSPASLPTFINDVAEEMARLVIDQSRRFAETRRAWLPLVAPAGGRRALDARVTDFTLGSDHEVYAEGSWRIPSIYLNDWPDRYIHTNRDRVENIDSTKLLRAGFIAAASGYALARLEASQTGKLSQLVRRHALARAARALRRASRLHPAEAANLLRFRLRSERSIFSSIASFAPLSPSLVRSQREFLKDLARLLGVEPADPLPAAPVYRRRPRPKGPMSAFGYSYLGDHLSRLGLAPPRLLDYSGLWGGGAEYAYEALNLVDGQRSVARIRQELSAIYGPVPLELVEEFLERLRKIGVLEMAGTGH